jgi:hypothetical protein
MEDEENPTPSSSNTKNESKYHKSILLFPQFTKFEI